MEGLNLDLIATLLRMGPECVVKSHLANLLRDETHHEYNDRRYKKHCAHICEATLGDKGINLANNS